MPIVAGQITVSNVTAALIHQTDADGCGIVIAADISPGQHVELGPSSVTAANGFIFDGGTNLHFTMPPGSALYAITNTGSCIVSKLVGN